MNTILLLAFCVFAVAVLLVLPAFAPFGPAGPDGKPGRRQSFRIALVTVPAALILSWVAYVIMANDVAANRDHYDFDVKQNNQVTIGVSGGSIHRDGPQSATR